MGTSILKYTVLFIAFIDYLCFNEVMHRVCMQDFYTCLPGHEEAATAVIHNRAHKLVKDMHYEAQVQCVINYSGSILKQRIKKAEARTIRLTQEQYL